MLPSNFQGECGKRPKRDPRISPSGDSTSSTWRSAAQARRSSSSSPGSNSPGALAATTSATTEPAAAPTEQALSAEAQSPTAATADAGAEGVGVAADAPASAEAAGHAGAAAGVGAGLSTAAWAAAEEAQPDEADCLRLADGCGVGRITTGARCGEAVRFQAAFPMLLPRVWDEIAGAADAAAACNGASGVEDEEPSAPTGLDSGEASSSSTWKASRATSSCVRIFDNHEGFAAPWAPAGPFPPAGRQGGVSGKRGCAGTSSVGTASDGPPRWALDKLEDLCPAELPAADPFSACGGEDIGGNLGGVFGTAGCTSLAPGICGLGGQRPTSGGLGEASREGG
mmetsp:Transcript_100509/g.269990  ORF Transcript_100509/g.269990 Transcript_100509/m.269990 type:complete len:341 (-) Transcript_100509:672-1694(-)